MLNIGSLILGACAWLFAAFAISASKPFASHRSSLISFTLCALALVLQLLEMHRRVQLGDYAAIGDTVQAVVIASVVLVSVTVILNFVALMKAKIQ